MTVYVLMEPCDVRLYGLWGVFSSLEAAQAHCADDPDFVYDEPVWTEHRESGGRYDRGQRYWSLSGSLNGSRFSEVARIEEHEVQGLTRDHVDMEKFPCGCGRDVVVQFACPSCDNDE